MFSLTAVGVCMIPSLILKAAVEISENWIVWGCAGSQKGSITTTLSVISGSEETELVDELSFIVEIQLASLNLSANRFT